MKPIHKNTLFYGDNLHILREHIPDESVDLIYLDPPFNSNRSYNVLFKEENGLEAEAQITAFDDAWHWGLAAEELYNDLVTNSNPEVSTMIGALRQFIGNNQMMAYLVMMAARLVELHRVLKPTGSLYLHCDPTASHYLKIILDTIFSPENYVNEIIWKRTSSHSDTGQGAKHFGRVHDVILFYARSSDAVWNSQFVPFSDDYIKHHYPYIETKTGRRYGLWDITGPGGAAKGNPLYEIFGITKYWRYSRQKMEQKINEGKVIQPKPGAVPREIRYLDEAQGVALGTVWSDVDPINSQAAERLGYPTQKPLALLERIINASSLPGEVVLDPFSGCGTAISASQKLGRKWIGIDITHLAIAMHKSRLKSMFNLVPVYNYDVIGEPGDMASAKQLATEDRYQFQWWALSLVQARPVGGTEGDKAGKKGADKGIDGVIALIDDRAGKVKRVLIQVKSGHVNSATIRDLRGVLDREKDAPIGVLITLEKPTGEMTKEAVSAGFYTSEIWKKDYPKIQIFTIEELLKGAEIKMPPAYDAFKQAKKEKEPGVTQSGFDF